MTNRDDLSDLRSALAAATPAPDTARRAQNIARAGEVLAGRHRNGSTSGGRWSWLRLPRFGGAFAGLATGATAVIAVSLLVLPDQPNLSEPKRLEAPEPELSTALDETALAPLAAEEMIAPQALSDSAEFAGAAASRGHLIADPFAMVAIELAQGRLPDPIGIDRTALLNSLASGMAVAPQAHYAVPWSAEIALMDSGDAFDPARFRLVPANAVSLSSATDQVTLVIAFAGFVERLATGADMNGWGLTEALALAESSDAPGFEEVVDLIRRAAEIDAG